MPVQSVLQAVWRKRARYTSGSTPDAGSTPGAFIGPGLTNQLFRNRRWRSAQRQSESNHFAAPEHILGERRIQGERQLALFFRNEHVDVCFLGRYRHEDLAAHAERSEVVMRCLGDVRQR